MSAAFHLNSKEVKRERNVKCNRETLPFCSEPKYLGVTLDRSLTYRHHLEPLRKKVTSSVALLRRVAVSGWGTGATTLRIATLALVHSTAEYCAPVWCHLIDPAINNALRIVTGCLRPTPADNLPTLAGIQSAELRRIGATLSLSRRAMEPGHLLHSAHLLVECRHTVPKIQTPICTRRTSHKFIWQQQSCGTVGGLPVECRVDGQPHKTPRSHPRHQHPLPWNDPPKKSLTASAPVSDVSAPVCTNGIWPPLRPVSVAQKNELSTMLSSNVQSIDLCMAWRFWTMRQLNGCSTPAPRSSAARQWFQQLAQKKKPNSGSPQNAYRGLLNGDL